ncbi:MAG: MinD/ParA family protein [Desulfopila sp.]
MATNTNISSDQAETLRSLNHGKQPPVREHEANGSITRVYSITSGKGGVGKTAVVANTAVTLSRMGKSVLILDADLGLANVDVIFGLAPRYNLNHFFSGEQELEKIMVDGPYGIKILPAGSGIQNFTRLDGHHKMRLLDGLDALHSNFDFVLIDTEAGISENVTYFNTAAQEILVVTTPEPTAITDAYALMKLLSTQFQERRFNLIVNQTHNDEEALDVYRKLTIVSNRYLDISIEYFGSVPTDRQMVDSIRKQRIYVDMHPNSAIAKAFITLANRLCDETSPSQPKGNLQFFWKKLLNLSNKG